MVSDFRSFWEAKGRLRLKRAVLAALVILCPLTAVVPAAAADVPDLYIVRNVPVDATDKTETAAREAARLQGEQDALKILLQRMTLPADYARLPAPSAAATADAVLSFEVVRERSSDVRYVGQMTYRFKPASVRRILRDAGIAFSETTSKPVVIVPVLIGGDGPQIWTDNPWKAAWAKVSGTTSSVLVPVTLPLGDSRDSDLAVPADLAQPTPQISPDNLAELSRRYGGGDIVIAVLKAGGTDVSVTRIGPTDPAVPAPHSVAIGPATADAPDADLYGRAVMAVRRDLDQSWKRSTATAPATSGTLQLDIPIAGLGDWVGLRDLLLKMPSVAKLDVTYLDQSSARATLAYRGDVQALKTVLAQQNLALSEGQPAWTLRRQDSSTAAAQPASASP